MKYWRNWWHLYMLRKVVGREVKPLFSAWGKPEHDKKWERIFSSKNKTFLTMPTHVQAIVYWSKYTTNMYWDYIYLKKYIKIYEWLSNWPAINNKNLHLLWHIKNANSICPANYAYDAFSNLCLFNEWRWRIPMNLAK